MLNSDRFWMYELNACYDSSPMNSGGREISIPTYGTEQSALLK
ncbi:putative carbamoyl-phosphate synthase L chain domain protein [Synechococcus sp. ROS8604]|nr:putative carbamoyl-phosphate synthase L chain domain protein [Synechococcus sp. ROS8604]